MYHKKERARRVRMEKRKKAVLTIDAYTATFPEPVRGRLLAMRETIRKAAATEKISYGIPTFYLNENLVHFAGYARHIGFYPTSSGIDAFAKELSRYKSGRGSVRFPLDEPLPLGLVRKIVRFRVKEVRSESPKRK
jgi:uncharacterized protein YdhG (YjbR/CyaY superfamily)